MKRYYARRFFLSVWRRYVCLINGHVWFYHDNGIAQLADISRECERCGTWDHYGL